jgi:hypothetical protein
MNSFPTNDFTSYDHANHPLLPFTPRQLGSLGEEAPTFTNDLFSNDLLNLGGFNVDTRVVPTPRVPPHGTLPRHVKPLIHRRLINIRRRRHGLLGAIPQRSPSQRVGFSALPQANVLATVAPQLSIDPFDGNTHPSASLIAGPSSTMFGRDVPRYHVSDMLVPQATPQFNTLPQSNTHVALAPQLTTDVFNNTSHAITHPSASCPPGSSSAAFENGEPQLSFSGIQNMPIPMTSGPVPSRLASSSSSSPPSLTWMTPIIPTSNPLIRPWDTGTASMDPATIPVLTSTTPARAEPPVPVSRCTCCKRVHPLVRVDDAIEWVRPDVMKMVLYFNWSSNAEDEAHESWEP